MMVTRVNRLKVFPVIRYLMLGGKAGGRRAAAAAMAEFKGAESNELVLRALEDPTPLWAVLPPALAVQLIGLLKVHARNLKKVGWGLVGANALALGILLSGASS